MLEYYLDDHAPPGSRDRYRAQLLNVRTYTTEDVVRRVMESGAGLTRSDVVSVLQAFTEVCVDIIAEGGAVNTELWAARPAVQGLAAAPDEGGIREVKVRCRPGTALRAAAAGLRARRGTAPGRGTVIDCVLDLKTGARDSGLTPGGLVKITGRKLKIAGAGPGCGLYFVNMAGGARAGVEGRDLISNLPSRLVAVVPPLPGGVYRVRVVTQYNGCSGLKTPREYTFPALLTVGA